MKTFYSPSQNGFYLSGINSPIPGDAKEITSKKHADLLAGQSAGKVISADRNGNPILMDPEPLAATVPVEITMRQCRLVLHREQLLPSVQTAIDALDEPLRTESQIEWDYATSVRRDSAVVGILAQALGLNDQRLDELFTAASQL